MGENSPPVCSRAVTWGEPYGAGPHYRLPDGRTVTMYRKGQRVRFYDGSGAQVGPEQRNVAPGVAYALTHGWQQVRP